ncbi:hypothetical protein [Sphingomonas aliaeris]|nr:hypothetical protein [Sphingomonas aliaeris]
MPGLLDWFTMMHDPNVEITKDNTTLNSSERRVPVPPRRRPPDQGRPAA